MGQSRLGLGEQLAYLKFHCPTFVSEVRGNRLCSVGRLQPTPLSREYEVEFSQRGGKSPEARVLSPRLERGPNDEEIPHMYGQERLCLFLPTGEEWKPSDPIALTIVPWASLWLAYYETWLATGEWLGGGVHPSIPITIRKERDEQRFTGQQARAAFPHPRP